MKFDTSKKGLNTLFQPYQAAILEHIWGQNERTKTGITSGQAHMYLKKTDDLELMKSRASVIFSLNDMVEEGILSYEEKTGRGGPYRVYYPKMNREEFAQFVVKTITKKLSEVFPSV